MLPFSYSRTDKILQNYGEEYVRASVHGEQLPRFPSHPLNLLKGPTSIKFFELESKGLSKTE